MLCFLSESSHIHVPICRYARESVYDDKKIARLLEVCTTVLLEDSSKWQRTAEQSLQHFQKLIMDSAVDRPPKSQGLFKPSEAVSIVDFMLQSYYRHFKLYKYCLATVPERRIRQVEPAGVEPPMASPPLATFLPMPHMGGF